MNSPTTASPTPYACDIRSATAPMFARLHPALAARAKPPSAARVRTRATLHRLLRRRPVRARLCTVAAQLHRAPRRRTVRRAVVERPAAVAAGLEPSPRAVEHRPEGDRDDPVELILAAADLRATRFVELACAAARPQRSTPRRLPARAASRCSPAPAPASLTQRPRPAGSATEAVLGEPLGRASRRSCSRSMLFTNSCTSRKRLRRGSRDVVAGAHRICLDTSILCSTGVRSFAASPSLCASSPRRLTTGGQRLAARRARRRRRRRRAGGRARRPPGDAGPRAPTGDRPARSPATARCTVAWSGAENDFARLNRLVAPRVHEITGHDPSAAMLFREASIQQRLVNLRAADDLERYVRLVSGRLPQRVPPVALRGAAPAGQGADPVDAAPAADRGRPRGAEARHAVRAVRPAGSADRDGRARRPVPHAAAVADRDRERRRRALRQHRARDVLPLVRLVRARSGPATSTRGTVDAFRSKGAAPDRRDRGELGRVPGDRADRRARDGGRRRRPPLSRRLLLLGGEGGALLLAFTILAAAAMRRDVNDARRRLIVVRRPAVAGRAAHVRGVALRWRRPARSPAGSWAEAPRP